MSNPIRPSYWCLHIVPLVFVGTLLSLAVRTHWVDDDRYGLAMFSDIHDYYIDYWWDMADGTRVTYMPEDLEGMQQSILPKRRARETILGRGFPGQMIRPYLAHVFEKHRPEGAVAIRAKLRIRGAMRRKFEVERFVYPPQRTP